MRKPLRIALIALVCMAVSAVIVVVMARAVGETPGEVLVTPAEAEAASTPTTQPPSAAAAADPAAVQTFLEAWAASETTTTTAAPPPPPTTVKPKPKPAIASAPAQQGSGACGGDLPPCYVMQRESGGNIRAKNPRSTASGKWQFLDSTWGGYGGYSRAMDAPEEVQDARARALWANGRGCSHWSAC